ncbi:hypothetical protein PC119_g22256 [Phytophthora cactorum]|nr:hypothetical protein PC119_g22256 [Phytophthora cactorum]
MGGFYEHTLVWPEHDCLDLEHVSRSFTHIIQHDVALCELAVQEQLLEQAAGSVS